MSLQLFGDDGQPLEPADIVLVRGDGFVQWLIRQKERAKGEPPSRVNHAGIMFTTSMLIEAQVKGVKCRDLVEAYAGSGWELAIYRATNITDAQRQRIAARAYRYVGDRYGFGKILLHACGLQRFSFIDRWPICSYVVSMAYASEGLTFGVSARAADPDDLMDFCEANPDKYRCVRMLRPLEVA